eukprot:CAMPEP_0201680710 /NCGR_PEP_ID=MMETSP0494-20130426/50739_1 /ASSEMBLY_ACC=CAM_ASM_000839 /TAXON_ID=420259 /ORGANISM="Thalassiosira gravida, Strain GMp14c1" /LENGTH=335 /DNA_ID=CAMNT_0048164437 /DNA_START=64 /DNA_END=1072 /DNA_ORIENTATION=-
MMNMNGTKTSTCGNVYDIAGGRKTVGSIVACEGTEGAVLVNMGHDDAVVFTDEVESVPSLELDSESDDEEEEEEEEWDSGEESLEDDEEDAELDEGLAERRRIFADARALKTLAVAYAHPQRGVTSAGGACFGRNYFGRPSAAETEEDEFADERAEILEEAAALKKLATDYMHPEVGVITTDATVSAATTSLVPVISTDGAAFGRNYFSRPSAPEVEDVEEAEERALVLAEAAALKKSAVDYMHPEVGVTTTDGACFGRNYFNRYSASEVDVPKKETESPQASQDMAAVQSLAAAVKGANLPSTKLTKLSSSDHDVSGAKKSASTVNLFGLSEAF